VDAPIERLRAISEDVYRCTRGCPGIVCRPADGMRPRGPLIQLRTSLSGVPTLIVGLNPGRPAEAERTELRTAASHEDWRVWCAENLFEKNDYTKRLTALAADIGAEGDLVWTNVAKCETPEGRRGVPFETQRQCASNFLVRELAATPKESLVIAAGKDAFVALNYLALERIVVGVPHPTGASPQYHRLLAERKLRPELTARVVAARRAGAPAALWLAVE
jgi:hypothetical protein